MSSPETEVLQSVLKKIGRIFFNDLSENKKVALDAEIRAKKEFIAERERTLSNCYEVALPELQKKRDQAIDHLAKMQGNRPGYLKTYGGEVGFTEKVNELEMIRKSKEKEIENINGYIETLKGTIKKAKEDVVQLEAKKKIMGMASKRGFFQTPQYRLEVVPESDKKHLSQKTKPPASPKMRT